MPEIKNTFLKSKMNKDLDSRIIPNGEYRDAENVSVSTSEGADVGALENILGNIEVADFGLTDLNLEIIGHCTDVSNNRIFFFITNYTDASVGISTNLSVPDASFSDATSNWTRTGSANYICYAQISGDAIDVNVTNVSSGILVAGTFLNFSKTHPILGVNVLEDLLFWTDDRNQPRKINIERALGNPYISITSPGYYTHEDHISVAKYAPYTSINFLKEVNVGGEKETTLINEVDEWLPPIVTCSGEIFDGGTDDSIRVQNPIGDNNIIDYIGNGNIDIKVTLTGETGEAYLDSFDSTFSDYMFYLKDKDGNRISNIPQVYGTSFGGEAFINKDVEFSIKNPNYNNKFEGDVDLLKDKFVRFSYRFKYDDGEYSLTAPFSQHAFVPKQFGYFIGDDDSKTAESSIVDFMENQVTTAGLMIDLPFSPNDLANNLHVDELQILYKASDEQSLKVVADIDSEGLRQGLASTLTVDNGGTGFSTTTFVNTQGGSGTGLRVNIVGVVGGVIDSVNVITHGTGYKIGDVITIPSPTSGGTSAELTIASLESKYLYNYKSQSPIKVLPEKEIVRVSDIVPLKAKTQEIVGNRIIYGNFLQNNETPNSLKYAVKRFEKGFDNSLKINEELLNHTLKQNRTYQVGVVLQDRYGRSSNVIINNDNTGLTEFSSTYFSPYSNGGVDPLSWLGNSLAVEFDEKINTTKTLSYNGIWVDKENPTGWYTYKIVIKQQEQDYYNIYVPGSLSGNIVYDPMYLFSAGNPPSIPAVYFPVINYNKENGVNHIALFNDNINKIPRNLSEVGPSDKIYSSETVLYNRVNNRNVDVEIGLADISQQTLIVDSNEVTSIKPFSEVGDWVALKGIDVHYLNMDPSDGSSQYTNTSTFAYPGELGNIDPFFLENNKNPLIATIKTKRRIGATIDQQYGIRNSANSFEFSKTLTIFETKPVKSEIDIYYETSSSGTIEEFNTNVESNVNVPVITNTTNVVSIYKEGIDTSGNDYISNNFQIVDQTGSVFADSSIDVKVNSVKDVANTTLAQQNWPFEIIKSVPGSGLFNQAQFVFVRKLPQAFLANSVVNDNYIITVQVVNNSGANILIPNITLNLSNNKPLIGAMCTGGGFSLTTFPTDTTNGNTLFNFYNNPITNTPPGLPLDSSILIGFLGNNVVQTFDNNNLETNTQENDGLGYVEIARFGYTSNGSVQSFTGSEEFSDYLLRLQQLSSGGSAPLRLNQLEHKVEVLAMHICDLSNPAIINPTLPVSTSEISNSFTIRNLQNGTQPTVTMNVTLSLIDSLNLKSSAKIVTLKCTLEDCFGGNQKETSVEYIIRFILEK